MENLQDDPQVPAAPRMNQIRCKLGVYYSSRRMSGRASVPRVKSIIFAEPWNNTDTETVEITTVRVQIGPSRAQFYEEMSRSDELHVRRCPVPLAKKNSFVQL